MGGGVRCEFKGEVDEIVTREQRAVLWARGPCDRLYAAVPGIPSVQGRA
jgi:hypothetical protein